MSTSLLRNFSFAILLAGCASTSQNTKPVEKSTTAPTTTIEQPTIDSSMKLRSLMDLPQTENGGFVLTPGFYEAEFKTYCLQPGTPDPSPRDAYLQGPVTGYRKEIVESILLNSRDRTDIDQKNIQLLLWSVVSGSNFDHLAYSVKTDAAKILTQKQIFELRGGVIGIIKTVSNNTGLLNVNSDMKRLFEMGTSSYEAYERLAVLNQPSKIRRTDVKKEQWYKQKENYFIRYFPLSYKKVRIQVYVPEGTLDADGKQNGEFVVYDPTGLQAMPAFTNAQKLGIGGPVIDIIRVIIQTNKQPEIKRKVPETKKSAPVKKAAD